MRAPWALVVASLAGACSLPEPPKPEFVTPRCTGRVHSDVDALYAMCSLSLAPVQLRRLDAEGSDLWSANLDARLLVAPPGDELIAADLRDIVAVNKATGATRQVYRRTSGGEVDSLALAAGNIYWIERTGPTWAVERAPLAGGIATTVFTSPRRLSSIGADAEAVYWVDVDETGTELRRLDLATDQIGVLTRIDAIPAFLPLWVDADGIIVEMIDGASRDVVAYRLQRPTFEAVDLGAVNGTVAAAEEYLLIGNRRFDRATGETASMMPPRTSELLTIAVLGDYVYWNDLEGLWRWPIALEFPEGPRLLLPDYDGPPLVGSTY